MVYEDGLLGLGYNEDYFRVNDKGELEPHPYILGNRTYSGPTATEFTALGTLGASVLYPNTGPSGQLLAGGTFGTFTKPDEQHAALIEITSDVRFFVYQIIESAFPQGSGGDGNNPFFVDGVNSVILDIRTLSPTEGVSWYTLQRTTVTTDEANRSNSWYVESRPVYYSTTSNNGFIWEWRIRYQNNSGGFPSNVSFTSGTFYVRSFPVSSIEDGTI